MTYDVSSRTVNPNIRMTIAVVWLIIHCLCQLCNGTARSNAESRRMPFTEQTPNTPVSAFVTLAPPSTTIVASCANAANVNMDASQFSVGPYDDFAVSVCVCVASVVITMTPRLLTLTLQ